MPERQTPANLITRREAILAVTRMLGGAALVGQAAILAGCEREAATEAAAQGGDVGIFAGEDVERLAEIAESILAETATSGAKAAGVGPFIAIVVTDLPNGQGLGDIDRRANEAFGSSFLAAAPAERLSDRRPHSAR